MSSPNFIDYIKFCSRSGHGGAGYLHFQREKFIQHGGPDGGDGGRGGHVKLKGNAQLWTLLHLKYRKHVVATVGNRGEEQNRTGAQGKDEVLEVHIPFIEGYAYTGDWQQAQKLTLQANRITEAMNKILCPTGSASSLPLPLRRSESRLCSK